MPSPNNWTEYRRLFDDFVNESRLDHRLLVSEVAALRSEIATLRTRSAVAAVKSGLWGTLGGFLGVLAVVAAKSIL